MTTPTLAVSSWTFVPHFHAGHMDLPAFLAAVRGFGIDQVELNNHFFPSISSAAIADLKTALDGYGIRPVNIAIDDGLGFAYNSDAERSLHQDRGALYGGLASADEALRELAIERTIGWLDIAADLGCPWVRNNTGGPAPGHPDEDGSVERCADSFRRLADAAKSRGIGVIIENHGGISSDIDKLDRLFELVDRDNLKQAVDFGNWPHERRVESLERSFHRAGIVHPKMHDFDEEGDQIDWDHHDLARRTLAGAPPVPWVIEYEGRREDAFTGLRKGIDLIERSWRNATPHI